MPGFWWPCQAGFLAEPTLATLNTVQASINSDNDLVGGNCNMRWVWRGESDLASVACMEPDFVVWGEGGLFRNKGGAR